MIAPLDTQPELDFSDDVIDRGVAAFFSVREVRPGRSILRERVRAAVATVLDAGGLQDARTTSPHLVPSPHSTDAPRARRPSP
jgi:hypothetical protein